mgnify:CR=1 FL=1
MARALINVPQKARRGEIIEIRTLIQHPMETGYRVGYNGTLIARDIIQTFSCAWNGVEIFRSEMSSAIAANPFLSFTTVAMESGEVTFRWTGDNGFEATEVARITVE